ncbi:MAG: hypothetical protein IJP66_05495 [Kiritimatiellae bacterium]|nr:hypothetical protein [Kiritimatiellia bacterium]
MKKAFSLAALAAIVFMPSAALCTAKQVWFSQGATIHASERLRFGLSNTIYVEHGEHFCDEEAGYFRWTFLDRWAAGAGASCSQDRVERESVNEDGLPVVRHHWDWSGRPTEHLALDWSASAGDWRFLDSNRIYLYFRENERDWAVYRNIATVTAPPVPRLPWTPRPYFTQFIYFTGRDGYDGSDRFCEFRWISGMSVRPLERLSLAAYWQYRDIETTPGEWTQVHIAGFSAHLLF